MEQKIKEAATILRNAKHAIAFTGAGISVESGIPPFRGEDGLWNKYDPSVLDLHYFHSNPESSWKIIKEIFYEYYGNVKPNKAHEVVSTLEQKKIIKSVITQNIDNLHQEAGSKNVIEFHGTCQTLICTSCNSVFNVDEIDFSSPIPRCKKCNGILKPNFVFFGEGIPESASVSAHKESSKSDVMLIIGTTGEIMPASLIPMEATKNNTTIIEVNPNPSTYTNTITSLFLKGKATEIMKSLEEYIF